VDADTAVLADREVELAGAAYWGGSSCPGRRLGASSNGAEPAQELGDGADLSIRVVFRLPLMVTAVTVKVMSRAMVPGRKPGQDQGASFRRRARIPADSCRMTSPDPPGRTSRGPGGEGLRAVLDAPGQVSAGAGETGSAPA
jgi:hypothetical protein